MGSVTLAVAARAARSRFLVPAAAIGVYVVIAVVAYNTVGPFGGARMIGCACSDVAQETWFLAWPAYAVTHGTSPLFSSLLDYPHGVNLVDNTSMPLLGLLAAPITWLAGPVTAFNTMLCLAFAASATSMFFVVRRLVGWWPGAFAAGLVYAISPYMVGQGEGHLFLTFVPLPPVILLCVWEICRREDGSILGWSIALGLVSAAQFLISIEVLLSTTVAAVVVVLILAATRPAAARRRVRRVTGGIGVAAACFLPFAAYPVWFFFAGTRHVVGPPHPVASISLYRGDMLSTILPTRNELLAPRRLISIGNSFADRDTPENGVYLGIPYIAVLGALAVRYRREVVVAAAGVLCLVGVVLSLGSPLLVDGHDTHVPLPFWVIAHLPVLKGMVAIRFSLIEQLGAAVVLGGGLAGLRSERWFAARPAGAATAMVAVAVAAVVLVPLSPRWPYPSRPAPLPAYFLSSSVQEIPSSSVVLTYPFDVNPVNEAMVWQASAGMRFAIFGGQATVPGPNGAGTSIAPDVAPTAVVQLFLAAYSGSSVVAGRDRPGRGAVIPPLNRATEQSIVAFCRRYRVGAVIVHRVGEKPLLVEKYLAAAFGRAPATRGGVDVWYANGGVAGKW